MNKTDKIFVAGHRGLVGNAIYKYLLGKGYSNIVTRTRTELDLLNTYKVENFFKTEKIEYVFLAAAKVGGILANSTYPVNFLLENLKIQNNIIEASYKNNIKKLLFLGSSCIYPRLAPQPLKEEYLLTSPFEPTNEPYAIAKVAGIKLCNAFNKQYGTNYICAMPTNLYGPNDNYDLKNAHALPMLLRKIHEAKINNDKKFIVWGTGQPRREFLYVDDLAEACVFLMENYSCNDLGEFINVGKGTDCTILELIELIKEVVGINCSIEFDATKPDGIPRKILDSSRINKLGWTAKTDLKDGIMKTYQDFLQNGHIRN